MNVLSRIAGLVAGALLAASGALAQPAQVELTWLGQSAFRIATPGGKVILTDPWLLKNPLTPAPYKDLAALGKIDVLLATHGHGDHIADAPAIARLQNIPLWAPGDLNMTLTTLGVLPPAQLPRFNKSGRVTPVPGIGLTMTHAEHSSVYVWHNPATGKDETHPGGEPVGFIIELENGFRIWHMGDTGLFGDMKLIGEYYKPDLLLVPIGGHFVMDPKDAAYATKELIKPKMAWPIHYASNPFLKGTPAEFKAALGQTSIEMIEAVPGTKKEF